MLVKGKFLLKIPNFLVLIFFTYTNQLLADSKIDYSNNVFEYITTVKSIEADFIQTNRLNSYLRGKFYFKKANKFLFKYDDDYGISIISDGFWLLVKDEKLKNSTRYFLKGTPLYKILDPETYKDIEGKVIKKDGRDFYKVRFQYDNNDIDVFFSVSPIALHGWDINNAKGHKINVRLTNILENNKIPEEKFYFLENY